MNIRASLKWKIKLYSALASKNWRDVRFMDALMWKSGKHLPATNLQSIRRSQKLTRKWRKLNNDIYKMKGKQQEKREKAFEWKQNKSET